MGDAARHVLPVANLREFFRDTLHGALVRQHLAVEDQTEHYVVNLLTLFARSEALYESTPEGLRLKPLAAMLCEALEAAPGTAERHRYLQRLGDVSLFIAGFFAHGFATRLIDIDYHIAMGGCAYGALAQSTARGRGRVLRLYEIWLKTGSARSYARLKRLGVDPTTAAGTAFTH